MNNPIIIADPSSEEADLLKSILESAGFGYRCRTVPDIDGLNALVTADDAQVILVDQGLIEPAVLRRLNRIKREHPGLRVYVLAREVSAEQYRAAQEYSLDGFCQKDDDYPAMIDSIEQTIT